MPFLILCLFFIHSLEEEKVMGLRQKPQQAEMLDYLYQISGPRERSQEPKYMGVSEQFKSVPPFFGQISLII